MFVESKIKTKLLRQMGEAIRDFGMIEEGDRVMVCLSGGKDSYTMLDLLLDVRERAPVRFDVLAVNLDQKQPNFPAHVLPEYLASRGVPYRIVERDTYSTVMRLVPEGKTYCSACARMRRGILYQTAIEESRSAITPMTLSTPSCSTSSSSANSRRCRPSYAPTTGATRSSARSPTAAKRTSSSSPRRRNSRSFPATSAVRSRI